MEVQTAPFQSANGFGAEHTFGPNDTMDVDMKDDMDIDLTGDADFLAPGNEAAAHQFIADAQVIDSSQPFGSSTMESDAAPEKIFIRGLDDLTTDEVMRYAAEYFQRPERVQWINDHSANIVYKDSESAAQALAAFSDATLVDPSTLQPQEERKAKPFSWRDTPPELAVREATVSDVKVPRAREQSRFYLLHPDQDPQERRRKNNPKRNDGRDDRGDYKRRRFDDKEHRRRRDGGDNFDASMYDDDAGEDTYSSRSASADGGYRGRRRPRRGSGDLFTDRMSGRPGGRLRDRSASPLRDGDGRLGFQEDQPRRRTARQRSATPEHLRRPVEREYTQSNAGKELFPKTTKNTSLGEQSGASRELFPDKMTPVRSPKELFPNRTSNHRRTPAIDETSPLVKPRSLADRITGADRSTLFRASQNTRESEEQQGFDIRGAARSGISIRGAASDVPPVVKELFPSKAGNNAGKELFAEKIKGRGGARRRAEDMF